MISIFNSFLYISQIGNQWTNIADQFTLNRILRYNTTHLSTAHKFQILFLDLLASWVESTTSYKNVIAFVFRKHNFIFYSPSFTTIYFR